MKRPLELSQLVDSRLFSSTRNSPINFSELVKEFVEDGKRCTRGELVALVNHRLVPSGPIRGQGSDLWHEPLDENWREISTSTC